MEQEVVVERKRQRLIISTVSLASFIAAIDRYIVNISLPTIALYFNASAGEISWVVLAYMLFLTSSLLFFGKLGDRLSLSRIMAVGYLIFILGSFLCGISVNLGMLIIFRCIQGLGAAMLFAVGPACITKFLPVEIKGWAFGIMTTFAIFGVTVGAPLGGFISEYLNWRWIFLINIPVGIIAVILTLKAFPKKLIAKKRELKLDIKGTILSFLSILSLLYALSMGKQFGWTSRPIVFSFLASVLLATVFFFNERFCRYPLLDLALFKSKRFLFANIFNLAGVILLGGNIFLLPFYLIHVKGLKQAQAGLVILVYSVIYMCLAPFVGKLSDRISPGRLCSWGMFIGIVSSIFFSFTLNLPGLIPVFIFLILFAILYVLYIAPSANFIISLVPESQQGIASGVYRTGYNLSMALGTSLFAVIFTHALPHNPALGKTTHIGLPPNVLLNGFSAAYFFGGIACFIAFIFSLIASRSKA